MKKFLSFLGLLLIVIGYYNMPGMVSSAIPSAYYITPNKKTYENVVNCSGTIQSAAVKEIYLQSVIVPKEIMVEVGDIVEEGDLLARVDTDMTAKLNLSAAGILRDFSGNLIGSNQSTGKIDWVEMASSYGLNAVLNGGQIDYAGLANLLQNGGGTPDSHASSSGAIIGGESPAQIISPVSGTVTEVNLRSDAPSSAGISIFTITDTENFKVLCMVSESDIAKINVGDTAEVRGVGFAGSVYRGTVSKIYPTARKSLTGSDTVVDVEIELENHDSRLKPGFSAKVEIAGGNNYDLITVPYEAIRQDENNNEYVYVYENGKLKRQVVITGQELTDEVEVLGGLNYDSVVIYNPNGLIKEGSMISIKGRANEG